MKRLEFFFDYGSPWSYVANTRLPALRERTGCEIAYRPMLLGGIYKATGNRSPAQEPVEPKRRYGGLDLGRWVAHLEIPFRFNPHFPIDTLALMRAAHAAQRLGAFEALHPALFAAFWARGEDLADRAVVARVAETAGVDPAPLLELAARDEVKASLRATTDEAVARGVFGAPSFFVDGELYFGNDRLDFVERALGTGGGR